MKKFIVERKLPGAGNLTAKELQEIAKAFNTAIPRMDKPFPWLQSFITEDRIYSMQIAENENDILEHAKHVNFHVHMIEEIKTIIDPSNAA